VFELGDRSEDLKEHPADGGRRVDALVEHDEVHPLGLQLLGQRDQMLERPAEPIELGAGGSTFNRRRHEAIAVIDEGVIAPA